MRDLSSGVQSAIEADQVQPILFFEGEFASGTVRVWSGIGDLGWNSVTWTGVGSLGSVSSIDESADIQANGVTVTLSGIPSDLISLALQDSQQGKIGKIYFGFMSNGSVISDPVLMFEGRLDVPAIQEDGETSVIQITYESRLIDLQKPRDSLYTNEEQQLRYAGDLGFEFVPALQDAEIVWGRSGQSTINAT